MELGKGRQVSVSQASNQRSRVLWRRQARAGLSRACPGLAFWEDHLGTVEGEGIESGTTFGARLKSDWEVVPERSDRAPWAAF